MDTTKESKPSDWMKTQTNSTFTDELGCITDATDEEQGDLPYDGDVGITCKCNNNSGNLNDCTCTKGISGILNLACSEDNKGIKATANYETHPQPGDFCSRYRDATGTMGISFKMPESEATFKKELPVGNSSKPDDKEHLTDSKISNVLLRHFSKGELISRDQLIEWETIPETSFTESIDDTVNKPEPSEYIKSPLAHEQWATNLEEYHIKKYKEVNTGDKNQNSIKENRCVFKKPISCVGKCGCRQEDSQLINDNEDTRICQNMKEESALFKKTVSPHEQEYGQGQAHYYLPDFSKVVALEVKVPKRSDNINSVPTTEKTKSYGNLLKKSPIVNNILENKNYFNSDVENQEEMSIPELLQQLEVLPQSDFPHANTTIYSGGPGTSEVFTVHAPIPKQSTYGLSKARLQCGTTVTALPAAGTVEAYCINPSKLLPELTLGEQMSQILKDQTDQLIKKVEDFCKHVTQDTFLLQDNYMALNQLKRYLDALERNYLTAREEHRNLQLQNCKEKSVNVGEFDPERKVEGEIFRLGTLLEDIQEQAADSKCIFSSLLTSYESAHSSYSLCERFISPEEKYAAEGLASHSQSTLSKNLSADEESMKGNTSIQERKTGTCSVFIQRKPTDLSDTNLSSGSEDILTCESYNDSQSNELVNYETESCKTFNIGLCGERKGLKCRCPRGSRDEFKLGNYKEPALSCALCRNRSSGSSSYSEKRNSTQKAQKNKQPRVLLNRLSERQNFEAAKTCSSSTYDKVILSHQYLPSKRSAQSKSAITTRNRNANDSNAKALSSALDHAIQTANSLKKASERMVLAVSKDLAKVKRKQL